MAVPILMPSLSPTMTEGSLAKWCKNIGDEIKPGDIIAEVETDKATMEIEAIDEGILETVLYEDGTEGIAVNSLIAVLKSKNDTDKDINRIINDHKASIINQSKDSTKLEGVEEPVNASVIEKTEVIDIEEQKDSKNDLENKNEQQIINENNVSKEKADNRISISPLAKRMALQNNIDINFIDGSGPRGRIVKKDIDILLNKNNDLNKKVNYNYKENKSKKITSMRKVIAKRLILSKSTIPHFYLNINCNADNLLIARKDMNFDKTEEYKISVNDIIIKALSLALINVPEANCSWGNEEIIYYGSVNISIAVAVKNGLFTPVIRSAETLGIREISELMKDFITRANLGKLLPEEYEGGNFSISNLGMYNIDSFSAIINPPESGILAIGSIKKVPTVINNEIKICNIMSCQLSGDHRVIDGAVGAKLLNEFKIIIENPYKMLV